MMETSQTNTWGSGTMVSGASSLRETLSRIVRYCADAGRTHGWTFIRDAIAVALAFVLADLARFDGHLAPRYDSGLGMSLAFILPVYAVAIYLWGIHRRMWQFAGVSDLSALVESWTVGSVVISIADLLIGRAFLMPISVVLTGSVFALAGLLFVRIWPRLASRQGKQTTTSTRVLIVGAGQAGRLVATDLAARSDGAEHAIGFLDDAPDTWNRTIRGLPVLGSIDELPEIVAAHKIDTIAVAIPSASTRELDRVIALAQETDARIQVLPSQAEVVAGRSPSMHLRDIKLDALLDRIPSTAVLESALVRESIEGRVVLVTGGAGSIGSEICRQLITLKPARVLALDNNETGLFHLVQELSEKPGGELLTPVLTSVTAGPKLGKVFDRYRPDVVFHAAAYKHVPMLEMHSDEAAFVNVQGTLNVCRRAVEFGCERVVFVSTDKAVNPVNTLGYSKRIGELLVRAHQEGSRTIFCSVRFGNVMGSRGSAIPEFIRQIQSGGPVTVTHPEVERYFMTIPEAVSLVIQAGALAKGGELFMLDMGNPIKIGDLVKRLIRLHGLRVGKDIEIVYTGLRPGEKLTEQLVFEEEETRETEIPGTYLVMDPVRPSLTDLESGVAILTNTATCDETPTMLNLLARLANGETVGRPFRFGIQAAS